MSSCTAQSKLPRGRQHARSQVTALPSSMLNATPRPHLPINKEYTHKYFSNTDEREKKEEEENIYINIPPLYKPYTESILCKATRTNNSNHNKRERERERERERGGGRESERERGRESGREREEEEEEEEDINNNNTQTSCPIPPPPSILLLSVSQWLWESKPCFFLSFLLLFLSDTGWVRDNNRSWLGEALRNKTDRLTHSQNSCHPGNHDGRCIIRVNPVSSKSQAMPESLFLTDVTF